MDPRGTSEVPPRGTGENKKITWHKPTPTYCLRAFTVGGICKWLKHADCKSVLIEFAGSNPAPTTIKVRVERALRFIARSACRMRTKWSGRQGTGQNENNFPRQGVFLS